VVYLSPPLMSEKRVTLADVAAKAAVHVTTVSLAMRNHPRLPETTRRRIQALAQQMGYTPDPLLRALVAYRGGIIERRNTPTLAYVTNWTTQWGWKNVVAHGEFFDGAQDKAGELGYKLEHFWLKGEGMSQERLGQILYSRGITGVIIASHAREMGDDLQLKWENFSAVKIDYFPHQPALHNVTNNQSHIIRLAMQKVTAAGYQRIGFVMHRGWDHAVDHNWTAGYLGEQQHLPLKSRIPAHVFPQPLPVDRWFHEHATQVEVDLEPFKKWLERYQPEVLITKGAFVLPALQKLKWRVPQDIALVDIFLDQVDGVTAGVLQNHKTVGALAVEILAGQLQHNKYGVPAIPTTTYVDGTWHDGASCPIPIVTKAGLRKAGRASYSKASPS
jgi:LacI family transcriptional regulator